MPVRKRQIVKYAIDCKFIDIPICSHLLSLAILAEDDRDLYLRDHAMA
jgi:hypothetical protein